MQAEPRFDVATELRQYRLDRRHMLHAVGDVNAQDHMIVGRAVGNLGRKSHRLVAAGQGAFACPSDFDRISTHRANINLTRFRGHPMPPGKK
jgi:hypothetical protein